MISQRGSVLFYILIGVVLFSTLGYTIAAQMRAGGDMGAKEKAKLAAQSVLDYAEKAKITVQNMKLNGIATSALQFMKTGEAGYAAAPHDDKVFHPEGGGLPLQNLSEALDPATIAPVAGIYMVRNQIEDVGSAADEVIVSVRGLRRSVCEQINQLLRNSTTIPSTGGVAHNALFITGATLLDGTACAGCVGVRAQCVVQGGATTIYTFYSAIDPN